MTRPLRYRVLRTACSLLVIESLFVASSSQAQEKKQLDVTILTTQGIEAAQAGRWQEAKEKFETAWLKSNAYNIAANLALVEKHFGNNARAATLFAFALKTIPATEPPETKMQLEANLSEMRALVATLEINVDVAGCAVAHNGAIVGKTPITVEVFGPPGKQTLRFEKPGYRVEMREVDVAAGKSDTITVRLVAIGDQQPVSESLPMWPAIVGFSVAGAGILLGAGMSIASAVRSGDATDLARACAYGGYANCAMEGQSISDEADTFGNVGIAGFAVAGAALLFSIPYTVVAAGDRADDPVGFVPVVSPDFSGGLLRARF